MDGALERLQVHGCLDRMQELARGLERSEVGSVLFFLALIIVTFLV